MNAIARAGAVFVGSAMLVLLAGPCAAQGVNGCDVVTGLEGGTVSYKAAEKTIAEAYVACAYESLTDATASANYHLKASAHFMRAAGERERAGLFNGAFINYVRAYDEIDSALIIAIQSQWPASKTTVLRGIQHSLAIAIRRVASRGMRAL